MAALHQHSTVCAGMEYSDRADKLHKIASPPAVTAPSAQPAAASLPRLKKVALDPKAPVRIELDTDAPAFRKALEELADTLELPHDDDSEAMVRACAAVLEQKLSADARARAQTSPAATEKRGRARGKGRSGAPATFNLNDFPPGFDTGDETLNKVGKAGGCAGGCLRACVGEERQCHLTDTMKEKAAHANTGTLTHSRTLTRAHTHTRTHAHTQAAALLRLLYVSDLRRLQDEVNRLITSMQVCIFIYAFISAHAPYNMHACAHAYNQVRHTPGRSVCCVSVCWRAPA